MLSQKHLIDKVVYTFGQAVHVSTLMDPGLKLQRVERASRYCARRSYLSPLNALLPAVYYTSPSAHADISYAVVVSIIPCTL